MSWQKYSVNLVLGVPLSLPMIAHAINIGDTYVQTQQNQPLNASINVSDINPRTFSVKVAQAEIYRQLGLSKDSDIQVKFVPTSSNGGQIILTTSRPVNAPFTDVVLNITESGVTKTLPKTLLMPIDSSQKITTQANTTAFQSPQQTVVIGSGNAVQLPAIAPDTMPPQNTPLILTTTPLPTLPTSNLVAGTAPMTLTNDSSQHLRIQETRTFRRSEPNAINVTEQAPLTSAEAPSSLANTQLSQPTTSYRNRPNTMSGVASKSKKSQHSGDTITYTLQRNDNLWTIASGIAAANHQDIDSVMADIMAANPNAFPDNDPSKLIANTDLQLPKYKVVPSQIGIKAANKARQQYRQNKKSVTSPAASKKSTPIAKPVTTAKTTHKLAKTPNKSYHKPQRHTAPKKSTAIAAPTITKKSEMTIIAPNNANGSVQGQSDTKNKLTKGLSPQVVAQVQQKRQATAQQVTKVNKLNQDLVGTENRLKLQNAKLAQLEKRLKELNKK